MYPFMSERAVEFLPPGLDDRSLGSPARRYFHLCFHRIATVDDRPAVFPCNWSEEGFPSKMVIISSVAAEGQEHYPPGTVRSLNEVSVTGSLDLVILCHGAEMCQDGISRI